MKKTKNILSLLLISISLFLNYNSTKILAENKNLFFSHLSNEEKLSQYNRILDLLLFDSIQKSINEIYGENQREYWNFKIIEIERGYYPSPFNYRLTVKFQTFAGAHSEPYDDNIAVYDIINFSPLKIKEIKFEHHPTEN